MTIRWWAQRKTPQAWLDPRSQVPDGTPSTGLSLGWMLASRANLRFTRRVDDIEMCVVKARAPESRQPGSSAKCS
jgi:hypothetical protein